jgi:hypothetical protein
MIKPERYVGFQLNDDYVTYLEKQLDQMRFVVDLAGRWCEDQENGMTDGTICISAMKDIRRILKEGE